MYKRYYDGYGRVRKDIDPGEIIVPKDTSVQTANGEVNPEENREFSDNVAITAVNNNLRSGLPGLPFELDDLILIGILLFLLWDSDNNDPVMLVIIAFLLLGDVF